MPAPAHPRRHHRLAVVAVVLAVVGLVAAIGPRRSSAGSVAGAAPQAQEQSATVRDVGDGGWVSVERPERPGPHPVLLHVPGGGWATLDRTPVRTAFGHADALEQGWAVATVGYPTGEGVTAREQVAAVHAALRWSTGPDAAGMGLATPVVATGHSAGAHLLALAATRAQPAELPAALVLVAGVFDLGGDVQAAPMLAPGLASAFGCRDGACPGAEDLEPWRGARGDLPPTVLVHGRDDRVTPAASSERFAAALAAAGVPAELHLVDGGRHRGAGTDAVVRAALAALLDDVRAAGPGQGRAASSNR